MDSTQMRDRDAAYIAAASPDAVLALIRERDEARAEVRRLTEELAQAVKVRADAVFAEAHLRDDIAALADQHDGLKVADDLRGILEDV